MKNETTVQIYRDRENHAHRVEARDAAEGGVEFCTEGGGFLYRAPTRAAFDLRFEAAPPRSAVLRRGSFLLDCDEGEGHVGYTAGRLWNGWATPAFTREVIELVCAYYDQTWDGDALVLRCQGEDEIYETIRPRVYETEDGPLALYDTDGWCWDEVSADATASV